MILLLILLRCASFLPSIVMQVKNKKISQSSISTIAFEERSLFLLPWWRFLFLLKPKGLWLSRSSISTSPCLESIFSFTPESASKYFFGFIVLNLSTHLYDQVVFARISYISRFMYYLLKNIIFISPYIVLPKIGNQIMYIRLKKSSALWCSSSTAWPKSIRYGLISYIRITFKST